MNQSRSSHVPTILRSVQRQVLLPALLLASSSVLFLSGCSSGLNFAGNDAAGPADLSELHGTVHGGQYPVANSVVSLYEIGATSSSAQGYGAALGTPLGTATTNSAGTWSISSPTSCTNANDELYLVATGGEGGNTSGSQNSTSNSALVLTSVAGPCNNQFTNSFNIDEVTTVATEYALAGFSTNYQEVGTSTTNGIGLTNAFATVTNLVNLSTGDALETTPAYSTAPANTTPDVFSSIVPYDTINTLANVLSTCVNAAGGASDPGCTDLFSYTGGSNSLPQGDNGVQGPVASNTADAVLYIAHNPALPSASSFAESNVAAVWALPTPEAPFAPALKSAPNDFTLTLNFISGGLGGTNGNNTSGATYIAVDKAGQVWIANSNVNTVTSLTNLGAARSETTTDSGGSPTQGGYSLSSAIVLGGLDTDQNGNVWISDYENCVYGLNSSGAQLSGSPFTSDCASETGISAVAVDGSNNVWVGGPNVITSISNPSGALRSGFPVTSGFNSLSGFLAADESGNVWWTDGGNSHAGYISSTGTFTTAYSADLGTPSPYSAFAIGTKPTNPSLELWVGESANDAMTPVEAVSPFTVGTYSEITPGSDIGQAQMQADGNNRVFWANLGGGSVPANVTEYLASETQVSPTNGFTGGSVQTTLYQPSGFVIDQSGNAWILNYSNYDAINNAGPYAGKYAGNGVGASNMTEMIGIAGPSQPVNSYNAANSTYGKKP